MMHPRTPWLLLAVVTVVAASALLTAGPITPPTGPITPGGKTTQELYDAILNISGTAVAGRSVAVPGVNNTGGTYAISGGNFPVSGPLLGMRHGLSTPYSLQASGYIAGNTTFVNFTIMRELGTGSAATYKGETTGQSFGTATINVPSAAGTTIFTLSGGFLAGLRQYSIQCADGTFAAIEELDLVANQVKVQEPSGTSWNYNYVTRSGS